MFTLLCPTCMYKMKFSGYYLNHRPAYETVLKRLNIPIFPKDITLAVRASDARLGRFEGPAASWPRLGPKHLLQMLICVANQVKPPHQKVLF